MLSWIKSSIIYIIELIDVNCQIDEKTILHKLQKKNTELDSRTMNTKKIIRIIKWQSILYTESLQIRQSLPFTNNKIYINKHKVYKWK